MDFGIAAVPAITVLCYAVAEVVKATPLDNKWLPSLCMVLGGVLGVVAMAVMPSYPANDILSAAAVGAVSGWAATGINQTIRQLMP